MSGVNAGASAELGGDVADAERPLLRGRERGQETETGDGGRAPQQHGLARGCASRVEDAGVLHLLPRLIAPADLDRRIRVEPVGLELSYQAVETMRAPSAPAAAP